MLIHIGYHKTGTSWLQRAILQPKYGFAQLADHAEIDRWIVRPHGLQFEAHAVRAILQERRLRIQPGLVPVLSSEILSGHPFYGGTGSDVLAQRIAAIAPGAKILITIRSQTTVLPSLYMQYLQRGGTLRPKAFFQGTKAPGYRGFEPGHFEYHHLVRLYQNLFDSVCILTQESFATDPKAALLHLARFARCAELPEIQARDLEPQSKSAPQALVPFLRRLNHLRKSTLNPEPMLSLTHEHGLLTRALLATGRRMPAQSRPISAFVRDRFAKRYAPSNQTLDRLTRHKLDLSSYPQVASSPAFQRSAFTKAAGPVNAL